MEAITQKLLNGEFDVALLDQVVSAAYDPVSPHRAAANKALMQLQEAPDLWQAADGIIEKAQNPHSRFFGVQVLDDAIKTRCAETVITDHWLILTLSRLTLNFYALKDGRSCRQNRKRELKITWSRRSLRCRQTKH